MIKTAALTLLLLTTTSCLLNGQPGPALDPAADSAYLDPNGDFILYISNQSFALRRIDIRVEIDGQLVANNYFPVRDQHNFVPIRLALPEGLHTITASSRKADVHFKKEFESGENNAAVLAFWYSPKSETGEKHFDFKPTKQPVHFM